MLVKTDKANDVALLKVAGTFSALPVVSSRGAKLGESVFTIGFPNIELQGFAPKLTKGEISSLSGMQVMTPTRSFKSACRSSRAIPAGRW